MVGSVCNGLSSIHCIIHYSGTGTKGLISLKVEGQDNSLYARVGALVNNKRSIVFPVAPWHSRFLAQGSSTHKEHEYAEYASTTAAGESSPPNFTAQRLAGCLRSQCSRFILRAYSISYVESAIVYQPNQASSQPHHSGTSIINK